MSSYIAWRHSVLFLNISKRDCTPESPKNRIGYLIKDLIEQFDVKPAEIKTLFNNNLDATRVAELRGQFLAAGLSIWAESDGVVQTFLNDRKYRRVIESRN